MALLLNDFLKIPKDEFCNVRVKFNVWSSCENPLDVYKNNPERINTQWLFWRGAKKRYYPHAGIIAISFIPLGWDTWLLTTIKKITELFDVVNDVAYEGVEFKEYEPLYGRLVIKFHKSSRQGVRAYNSVANELIVHELLPDKFDGDEFPGYDNVLLTYDQLYRIVKNQKREWKTALQNQKAVYLITDTNTGKLYVGSATSSQGMLLSRWSSYVENGHGGNSRLVDLVKSKSFDYVKQHFIYSIIENYNAKVDDNIILARESWWKNVLASRTFGYNEA